MKNTSLFQHLHIPAVIELETCPTSVSAETLQSRKPYVNDIALLPESRYINNYPLAAAKSWRR